MKITNRSTFSIEGEILTLEDGSQKIAFNIEDFLQLQSNRSIKLTALDVADELEILGLQEFFSVKSSKQYTAIYSNNQTRPKAAIYVTGKKSLVLSIHNDCLGDEVNLAAIVADKRFPSTTRFVIYSREELTDLLESIQEPLRAFLLNHV